MDFNSPETVINALNELVKSVASGYADSSTVAHLLTSLSVEGAEVLQLNLKICLQDAIYKKCQDRTLIVKYWILLMRNLQAKGMQNELLPLLVYILKASLVLLFDEPKEASNSKLFMEEYSRVLRSLQLEKSSPFFNSILQCLFVFSSKLKNLELHSSWYLKMVYFLFITKEGTIQQQILFDRHKLSLFPFLQSHFSKYYSLSTMSDQQKKNYYIAIKLIFALCENALKIYDKDSYTFKDSLFGFLSKLKRYFLSQS